MQQLMYEKTEILSASAQDLLPHFASQALSHLLNPSTNIPAIVLASATAGPHCAIIILLMRYSPR